MNDVSLVSSLLTRPAGGIAATGRQKSAAEAGKSDAPEDRFGPAVTLDLSPTAQAMGNGAGTVQALMVDSLTNANQGYVNYGASFKAGLFSVADANHDGVMTLSELTQRAMAGGSDAADANAMFAVNDENHDGEVTAKEFSETMATPVENDTFGGQLFKMLDADGDGAVTKAEIERMLEKAGQSRDQVDEATVRLGVSA
jgi:hypothetical protein